MGTDARTPSHIRKLSLISEPEKHKRTQKGSFLGDKKKSPASHIPFTPGYIFSSHTHKIYYKSLKHSVIAIAAANGVDCSINSCSLLHAIKDLVPQHRKPTKRRKKKKESALVPGVAPHSPPGRTVPSGRVSPAASVL